MTRPHTTTPVRRPTDGSGGQADGVVLVQGGRPLPADAVVAVGPMPTRIAAQMRAILSGRPSARTGTSSAG